MELIEDARAVQSAGAFSLLLEAVPPEVCKIIRDDLAIPVYGIGAGVEADGQVMICQRHSGYFPGLYSKICKKVCESGRGDIEGHGGLC